LAPEFQGFADELRTLPGRYGELGGLLMVAWDGEKPAGTIALGRLSEESCEAKRLLVSPEFRVHGLGRARWAIERCTVIPCRRLLTRNRELLLISPHGAR